MNLIKNLIIPFVGKKQIAQTNGFWKKMDRILIKNGFLKFNDEQIEKKIQPYIDDLLLNNSNTQHFGIFVNLIVEQFSQFISNKTNYKVLESLHHKLSFLRIFLLLLISRTDHSNRIYLFSFPNNNNENENVNENDNNKNVDQNNKKNVNTNEKETKTNKDQNPKILMNSFTNLKELILKLLECLLKMQAKPETTSFLFEILYTFNVILSTTLFEQNVKQGFEKDLFFYLINKEIPKKTIKMLIAKMINLICNYDSTNLQPKKGWIDNFTGGASLLVSVPVSIIGFMIPSLKETNQPILTKYPLTQMSITLLLLLIYSPASISATNQLVENEAVVNLYNKKFSGLKDHKLNKENLENNNKWISFKLLSDTIKKLIEDDKIILLLYSLLNSNGSFLEYFLSRTDLDRFILPLLESLYTSDFEHDAEKNYIKIIILLILSQDVVFNTTINNNKIQKEIPWYKPWLLKDVSIGTVLVCVIGKVAQINLIKFENLYTVDNCLSLISNMAPFFDELHPPAARRLVNIFLIIMKKLNNYCLKKTKNEFELQKIGYLNTLFLKILEIINIALSLKPKQKKYIIYYIIQSFDKIFQDQFQWLSGNNKDAILQLLNNFKYYCKFISNQIDLQTSNKNKKNVSNEPKSIEEILQIIVNSSKFKKNSDRTSLQLQTRFKYSENQNSFDFFLPYIWLITIFDVGLLNVIKPKIKLFNSNDPESNK
ncbi:dymeclin [Anaeramoeba flamelloides]|uniref:Dymeclin n=1 Tax=Anaeramoeba flamelloides TaxID=1746091 RepID=A0ABQ8Z2A7_9EUKA|nr:dymeclin [Anaeramoeba flamelloides]